MNNIIINAINTTINKNEGDIPKSINDLDILHIDNYIKEPIETLNIFAILLSSDIKLYNKFIFPKNKINFDDYLKKIKSYDEDEIIDFVTCNIDVMSGIGEVQKYMLNKFIYTCEDEELLENGTLYTNIKNVLTLKRNVDKDMLKKYIRANTLIKIVENNLYIKPKSLTIEEYAKLLENNNEYSLSKVNDFKRMKGVATKKRQIILNIDYFSELYLSFIDLNDFYIELEKVINHEIYHKIQENNLAPKNRFPNVETYNYIKEISIVTMNNEFYKKYHDYFEVEISANIYAYQELLKKYKKDYINKKDKIDKIENKLHNEYSKRCTKEYDEINNEFDALALLNKNICKYSFFKYEYNDNNRKTLKELIEAKKIYENDLSKYINKYKKSNIIEDTIKFKEDMSDKEFINDIIFNAIFDMPIEYIKINMKSLNSNEKKVIKEALLYGKIKFINRYNLIENNKDTKALKYIKKCINKIENINILIQTKKLDNCKER